MLTRLRTAAARIRLNDSSRHGYRRSGGRLCAGFAGAGCAGRPSVAGYERGRQSRPYGGAMTLVMRLTVVAWVAGAFGLWAKAAEPIRPAQFESLHALIKPTPVEE